MGQEAGEGETLTGLFFKKAFLCACGTGEASGIETKAPVCHSWGKELKR